MPEKDVVGNVTSDLIALLPTNIIAYITIWQFTQVYEKTFNVKKHAFLSTGLIIS